MNFKGTCFKNDKFKKNNVMLIFYTNNKKLIINRSY